MLNYGYRGGFGRPGGGFGRPGLLPPPGPISQPPIPAMGGGFSRPGPVFQPPVPGSGGGYATPGPSITPGPISQPPVPGSGGGFATPGRDFVTPGPISQPPISGGGISNNPKFKPLGGFSSPGAGSGLPPRQGDGPPSVTSLRQGSLPLGRPTLPPPGVGGTLPPISPGTTGGGRPIGAPGNAETREMKGIYGGPPPRFGMQVNENGRVYGAANVWANMFKNGYKLPGNPDYTYTQEQADAATAGAKAQLAEAYASGSMGPLERMQYEDYLNRGPGQGRIADAMYNSEYGDPRYENGGFDANGLDQWDRVLASMGLSPQPRVGWGMNEQPTADQLREAEAAYYSWMNQGWQGQGLGANPGPTDLTGYNPAPDYSPGGGSLLNQYGLRRR